MVFTWDGRNQLVTFNHQSKGQCGYCNGHHSQCSNQNHLTCRDFCHWLIDHGLPRSKIDGSLQKSYLIYVFKRVLNLVNVNRRLTWITKIESYNPSTNSHTWFSSQTQNSQSVWEARALWGRTLLLCQKHTINLPSSKNSWSFFRVTMNLGGGINKLSMDYWVLAPIPKDTKHYSGP